MELPKSKREKQREKLRREIATLQALPACDYPFAAPRFVCQVHDDRGELLGIVETFLSGATLRHFEDRQSVKFIGKAAAATHRLPQAKFPHLPHDRDRANYATRLLRRIPAQLFETSSAAEQTRAWINEHLPDPLIGDCVIHGDLLPQNLITEIDAYNHSRRIISVVDWELSRIGDPAYDLAIVSRGNRKILKVQSGLHVMLAAYRRAGGARFPIHDVRVHEFLLLLRWMAEAIYRNRPRGHGPQFYEGKIMSLLQRAKEDPREEGIVKKES